MNEVIFFGHLVLVFIFLKVLAKTGTLFFAPPFFAVLANLFVLKQIELFGFVVTCSDVYAVGCLAAQNLLQESFGKEEAKKALLVSFLALVFMSIFSFCHLLYFPASCDITQRAYEGILGKFPKLSMVSILVFSLTQYFEIQLFSILRFWNFKTKMIVALLAAELLDTALFTTIGLYGLVAKPLQVFFVSFFIKAITALILGTFAEKKAYV